MNGQEIVGQWNKRISRSAGVDKSTRCNVHLTAGEKKLLSAGGELLAEARFIGARCIKRGPVVVGINKRPGSSTNRDVARGGDQGGTSDEMNAEAFNVHLGGLGETASWNFLFAGGIGQDAGGATRSKGNYSGELV